MNIGKPQRIIRIKEPKRQNPIKVPNWPKKKPSKKPIPVKIPEKVDNDGRN